MSSGWRVQAAAHAVHLPNARRPRWQWWTIKADSAQQVFGLFKITVVCIRPQGLVDAQYLFKRIDFIYIGSICHVALLCKISVFCTTCLLFLNLVTARLHGQIPNNKQGAVLSTKNVRDVLPLTLLDKSSYKQALRKIV